MQRCLSLFIILFVFFSNTLYAQVLADREVINEFASNIRIFDDATVMVSEKITVTALGKAIKRGIVREIPTVYTDRLGKKYQVYFHLSNVLINGRDSAYHTQETANGIKIYIGNKNTLLNPGTYTYTIEYQVKRVIGYFANYDELYWNVTGNYWQFPILQASAMITLPSNASITQSHAYTGRYGSSGQQYTVKKIKPNQIYFASSTTFNPGSGLTVAVAWPKGIVYQPTAVETFWATVKDNQGLVIALFMMLLLTVYYFITWWHVGRDFNGKSVIPLFYPPDGYSPAALRYIKKMRFDHKAFTAAIVSMAVKGFLTISESNHDYILQKTNSDHQALSPGEQAIAKKLFGSKDTVKLARKNHENIRGAIKKFKQKLKAEFARIYFNTNSVYLLPGVILSILALVILVTSAKDVAQTAFFIVWLSIWSFGCVGLCIAAWNSWTAVFRHKSSVTALGSAIISSLIAIPFFAGEIFGLYMLSENLSIYGMSLFIIIIALNVIFYELLKVHTFKGRQLINKIDGFKQYLSTAEQLRLDAANPPEKTPQLFERYLPFAIALNVETRWAEQFDEILNKAGSEQQYTPSWYRGNSFHHFTPSSMAAGLGSSLTSSISSSATAPGSSSGSGGGGFSGGGGGGGGGGGW